MHAMPGTDLAESYQRTHASYGTGIAYDHGACGTEIAYGHGPCGTDVSYGHATCHTDAAYGQVADTVATERLLPLLYPIAGQYCRSQRERVVPSESSVPQIA